MQNQKLTRTVILLCLTLAVVEFSLRGPLRTLILGTFTDFSGVYVASRQWVSNSDPYRASQFMQTWVAAGGEAFENRGSDANLRPAYPPSTLAIVAPFALFRWLWARDLFLISVVALFPILLRAVMRLGQTRWNTDTGLAGSAFAFALAPWHAAIAWQSITAPALELAIIGASIRSNFGSVLTGLALCLKPQLAAWFLLFEIVKKRWHRVSVALVIFAFVTLFAVTRMPVGWLSSYR